MTAREGWVLLVAAVFALSVVRFADAIENPEPNPYRPVVTTPSSP